MPFPIQNQKFIFFFIIFSVLLQIFLIRDKLTNMNSHKNDIF